METPHQQAKNQIPWLEWEPGDRVVVRYRAEDGVHDALGELIETAPHYVVIAARRGEVRVEARTMIVGRLVTKFRPVDSSTSEPDASSPQS